MAFKMKLSSKELDTPSNFKQTHADAIKAGSGALGDKGSVGELSPVLKGGAPVLAKDKKPSPEAIIEKQQEAYKKVATPDFSPKIEKEPVKKSKGKISTHLKGHEGYNPAFNSSNT